MPETKPQSDLQSIKLEKLKEISLPAAVLSCDLSHDGKTALAACQDGAVYLLNFESGQPELLGTHESYASGVLFGAESGMVLSSGYDGAIKWHSVADRKLVRSVNAHLFWSWDMDAARDGSVVATVTGRYEAGGYKYEPAAEKEPSVKIFDAKTGELRHQFEHLPPVQAVAISPDSRVVAAGNLMGDVRVWEIASGKKIAQWNTPELTSWGIVKSHHYLGGVFSMMFHPAGEELYLCGMGPMRDPMAGNGVQRWQRFSWRDGKKLDETHEGESGQGLMESMAFHPSGRVFVMAGRLFQGQWNLAFFDAANGKNLYAIDAKHRITEVVFNREGSSLLVAKAKQQDKKKEGKWPPYGAVELYSVSGVA